MRVKEFRLKLYPKDFYKVKEFYEKVLCFEIIHGWDHEDKKGVMFKVGPAIVELLWEQGQISPGYVSTDVSWQVDDVWELWEKLKDTQDVVFSLRDNDWGDTSFCISDPEGFSLTFFSKSKT